MNHSNSFLVNNQGDYALTIQKDGIELNLNPGERQKVLDAILEAPCGPAFTLSLETKDQIACFSCNKGNYNLLLCSANKDRLAVIGITPDAITALKNAIAQAIG